MQPYPDVRSPAFQQCFWPRGLPRTTPAPALRTEERSLQTVYTIAPSVEVGTEWWLANGTLIRPFVRGGATWYEGNDLALSSAFLGAPASVTPFTIHTNPDDVMGLVGAGIDVITGDDTVLHVTYDGQLGNDTQIHAIGLKGSARF